jgi:hypothetical protein
MPQAQVPQGSWHRSRPTQTSLKSSWHTQHPPSELAAAFQLQLASQLLPNGQQGAGSVGWAGQQLPKPGLFFLPERMETTG